MKFQPLILCILLALTGVLFQNCGPEGTYSGGTIVDPPLEEFEIANIEYFNSTDGQETQSSISMTESSAIIVTKVFSEVDEQIIESKINIEVTKQVQGELKNLLKDLSVENIQPSNTKDCELINAPPLMRLSTTSDTKLINLSSKSLALDVSKEIGARKRSCDPYVDITGKNRADFLALLNKIIDKAVRDKFSKAS